MSDSIEVITTTAGDTIEVVTQGPQGAQGATGPTGPAGSTTYGTTAGTATEGNDARIATIRSGSINTSDTGDGGLGGSINTSGDIYTDGGYINTSSFDGIPGGYIDTSGIEGAGSGGNVNTSGGGGSINTRGTGSIGLGFTGTRTTLVGSATTDKTVTLPNATGTVALTSMNSGTITASAPLFDLAQTWNNAAVAFTALRINVTNTASAAASDLIDAQIGGTTAMRLRRGSGALTTLHLSQYTNSGFYSPAPVWHGSTAGLMAATNLAIGSSLDTILERGGAGGILEQRNAANAQTFRIYNTYTSTTNFERLNIIAQSAGSVIIGTEKGSAGGTARALELRTNNVARITLGDAGGIGFFGAAAAAQPTAVADATDAATVITQLNALLSRMRTLGLIAT